MKILRLYFKNIHSLKGEHTIDFDCSPLADTGIFAITGPTGSGKSTILDAITLALYGRIPREGSQNITKSKVDELGAILTRNTNDCFAELHYESKGKAYRSLWSIRYNRNANIDDYHMELSLLDEEKTILSQKKSEVPNENTRIIGLNYEQFVKSILLAQGQFAGFLKADTSQRMALLEKITGIDIYRRLGQAAFYRYKQEWDVLERLKEKLSAIDLFSNEDKAKRHEQQQKHQQELVDLQQKLDKQNELLLIKKTIEQLKKELNIRKGHFEKVSLDFEAFKSDKERLNQHDLVLPLKAEIVSLDNMQKQLDEYQQRTETLSGERQAINKKIAASKMHRQNLEQQYQGVSRDFDALKPKIKKCRALDIEQQGVQKQLDELKAKLEKKTDSINKQEKDKTYLQSLISQLKESKKKRLEWLAKNQVLAQLPDDFPKLERLVSELVDQERKYTNHSDRLETPVLRNDLTATTKWSERDELLKQTIDSNSLQLESLKKELAGELESAKLRSKLDHLQNQLHVLGEQQNKQLEFKKQRLQTEKLTSQLAIRQKDLSVCSEQLELFKQQIEIKQRELELCQAALSFEQTKAGYGEARKHLTEGQACPLCGSTHHPYIDKYTDQLSESRQNLDKVKAEYEALQKDLQAQLVAQQKAQADNENIETQLASLQLDKTALQKAFNEVDAQHQLALTIEDTNALKCKQEDVKHQINTLNNQLNKLDQLHELKQQQPLLERLLEHVQQILQVRKKLSEYYQKYKEYLHEVKALNRILPVLAKCKEEHNTQSEAAEDFEKQVETNGQELRQKEIALQQTKENSHELKEQISGKQNDLKMLVYQRQELIAVADIDALETKKTKEVEAFEQQIIEQDKQLATDNIRLENTLNALADIEASYDDTSQNLLNQRQQLQKKLEKLSFASVDHARRSLLPDATAERLRNTWNELRERYSKAKQALEDNQQQYETKCKAVPESVDLSEIEQLVDKTQKSLQSTNQALGALKEALDENTRRETEATNLKKQLNDQNETYKRWKALNEYIGDREGKRFANFSQELTLRQLIYRANKHLKTINERYVIKTNTSDKKKMRQHNFTVIDTYQANTERSVSTLSGGESFLVSLALALGLSDLAGRKSKINSLFIDEGFGALDQDTLDIALAALERLQQKTDRTIGIISHVEALKERIRTQIILQKGSSGHSTLQLSS